MTIKSTITISLLITGISCIILIFGALYFQNLYHKIDKLFSYSGKIRKISDNIAIFIDKSINYQTGILGYSIGGIILRYFFSDNKILFLIRISSIASSSLCIFFLKRLSKKQRPQNARIQLTDFSFPSGHTAIATTVLLNISLIISTFISPTIGKAGIFILAFIGGISVGWTRRYLKVHRISDIIVGLLLGIFCFLVTYRGIVLL